MPTPSKLTRVCSALFICAAISTVSLTAAAEPSSVDSAAAQALFDQGRQLMSQGNYTEACPKFEESARIVGHSGTLLNLANCYEKQGRVTTAWSTFLSAAAAANRIGNADREAEARARASALAPSLPKIVINVAAADKSTNIAITRDGVAVGQVQFGVPIPADPGVHKVTASMPGHKTWETTVEIKSKGETVQVDVPTLEALPAVALAAPAREATQLPREEQANKSKSNSQRTVALVVGGVGVVGVAVGSVAGLVSKSKHDNADDHCSGSNCNDSQGVSLRSDARLWGNISTVAFIVGAAGLATGVTLWISAPKAESQPGTQVAVGPGSILVKGSW